MREVLLILIALGSALITTEAASAHKQYAAVDPKIFCRSDRVVWVNTESKVYHYKGERWFGRTKNGQFECEKAARAEGDRATRNEQ